MAFDSEKLTREELDVPTVMEDELKTSKVERDIARNRVMYLEQQLADIRQELSNKISKERQTDIFKKLETDERVEQRQRQIDQLISEKDDLHRQMTRLIDEMRVKDDRYQQFMTDVEANKNLIVKMRRVKSVEGQLEMLENKLLKKQQLLTQVTSQVEELRASYNGLVDEYNGQLREYKSSVLLQKTMAQELSKIKRKLNMFDPPKKIKETNDSPSFFKRILRRETK